MRAVRAIAVWALALAAISGAFAIPRPGSPAIQPANGYARITRNSGPLDVTVTATRAGFGVFWVAIFPGNSRYSLSPAGNDVRWSPAPDAGAAVWRTNNGSGPSGQTLVPPGTSGYRGNPSQGRFMAFGRDTDPTVILHVINLRTQQTFWAYPDEPAEPPVAVDDCTGNFTYVNTPVQIDVLANDTDPNGYPLQVVRVSAPAHGTATVAPDGLSVVYLPAAGYIGGDSFTYTVSNGQCEGAQSRSGQGVSASLNCDPPAPAGCEDTAKVCLTVKARPLQPPVANDDCTNIITSINTPITIPVLANDTDPNGYALTVVAVGRPAHGVAVITADRQGILYTPYRGYTGPDTFTYTISNGHCTTTSRVGGTSASINCVTPSSCQDSAKVCLIVKPRTVQPPVANDDCTNNVTEANTAITIPVLANDTDPNGYPLTIVAITSPSHGRAALSPDGKSIVYTPYRNYTGPDTFQYTISNGQCGSASRASRGASLNCTPTPSDCQDTARVCVLVKCAEPEVGKLCATAVCAASGAPMAGVNVTISGPGGTFTGVTSGAEGKACFDNLKPGDYTVKVDEVAGGLRVIGTGSATASVTANQTAAAAFSYQGGAISGFVYKDATGACVHDASSESLAGIRVALSGPGGLSLSTLTDATGAFSFSGCAIVAGGYTLTVSGASDALVLQSPSTGTLAVNLGAGAAAPNNNFCYTDKPGRLCVYAVCGATNGTPVAGVHVTVSGPGGTFTGTTDAKGTYCVDGLKPGDYTVTMESPAQGLAITGDSTASVTVTAGGSADKTFVYQGGQISGYVYQDTSGNCNHDASPINLAGVPITIASAAGFTRTVTTDENGYYSLAGCEVVAGDYTITAPEKIGTLRVKSGATLSFTLSPGDSRPNNNFCYEEIPGKLCVTAVCAASSAPMAGVHVTIKGPGGTFEAVTAGAEGKACFDDLKPGDYSVTVDEVAGGVAIDGAATASATVISDQTVNVPFTYHGGSISGYVYQDTSGNCTHDSSAINLANVPLQITFPDGTKTTLTTDATGKFTISGCNVTDGKYTLQAFDTFDTFFLKSAGTIEINLAPGQSSENNNFCYDKLGKLCVHAVCGATNGTPVAGVHVTVSGPGGTFTGTTDAKGTYCVDGLKPGDYTVTMESPAQGLAVTEDSTASVTVTAGGSADKTFVYQGGQIYGYVFEDTSGRCESTSGSKPLGGVPITITYPDGTVETVLTLADGTFSVSGCKVVAGQYTVEAPGNVTGLDLSTSKVLVFNLGPAEVVGGKDFCYHKTPSCSKILVYYWDQTVGNSIVSALRARGVPESDIDAVQQAGPNAYNAATNPDPLKRILEAKTANGGLPYCSMFFDPEIVGPCGQWFGPSENDQIALRGAIADGMGFVYCEPYNSALTNDHPQGQLPLVLPVYPVTIMDTTVQYGIVIDANHPLADGLVHNPFIALSGSQNNSITLLAPPAGFAYANQTVVGTAISTQFGATSPYVAGPVVWTLDYARSGASSTSGRVVIIGTDPFPTTPANPDFADIQTLYANALKYAAGLVP